jgi:hypothetical protein
VVHIHPKKRGAFTTASFIRRSSTVGRAATASCTQHLTPVSTVLSHGYCYGRTYQEGFGIGKLAFPKVARFIIVIDAARPVAYQR